MKRYRLKRFETGLLVMVTVLFLYAPAGEETGTREPPEFRFRTAELVQEIADWFGTTFFAETSSGRRQAIISPADIPHHIACPD